MLKIHYYGTIRDLNDKDLILISDSQDVDFTKSMLTGTTDKRCKAQKQLKDYNLFLVSISNGDYCEIYASTNNVAWLNAHVDKISV